MSASPPADDVLARLRGAGPGELAWLPVNGGTFAPLLRPGDRIGVEACTEDGLRRGDLALVRSDGTWSVRVVASAEPLRTGSLQGAMDREPGEVHGRVVAFARGERTRPFGARHRAAAWALQRAGAAARAALGPTVRAFRATRAARRMRGRRIGPVRVRLVRADDAEALDLFAAENLPRMRDYIVRAARGRWEHAGVAVAAFDRAGVIRGFLFVDEYAAEGVSLPGHWIRAVSVDPSARRLGLAAELLREACAEAHRRGVTEVRADVLVDNAPSLALFRRLGFETAAPEMIGAANALLVGPDETPRTVVEAALPLADPQS